MPYPIHDWKDGTKYLPDPLAGAPTEFIAEHRKLNQSDDEVRTVLWRWQFLRRHKLYQDNWQSNDEEYINLFDVGDSKRPDPKTDYPAGLVFYTDLFAGDPIVPASIDLRKSWAENARDLKWRYTLLSLTNTNCQFPYLFRPEQESERERQLGQAKYPNLLRVLDALAVKETLTQIARELEGGLSQGSLVKTASRWRNQAFALQAEVTRLPSMGKRDK